MISQGTDSWYNGEPQRVIVGYVMHIVNKTLPGLLLEHVFAFMRQVCIVQRYCSSHPLNTKDLCVAKRHDSPRTMISKVSHA